MNKNTSVELGEEIHGFVAGKVQSDRYGSASGVIPAGVRLLQDQETQMAILRAALNRGENAVVPVSSRVQS